MPAQLKALSSGVVPARAVHGRRVGPDHYSDGASLSNFARVMPRIETIIVAPRSTQLGVEVRSQFMGAYNAGPCCPRIVPAYFVKTQASPGEVVGKCFCSQSACKISGRRVITMPSFSIYPEAFLGRMLWDLPIKASCVS